MASHFVLQQNKDGSVNLTQKSQVLAEVCGKVNYVNPKNKKLFGIHAEKMDRKFRCILSYDNPFCPLREGDAIFAMAEYVNDPRYGDTLNIIQPPFVVLGEDKNTIIKSFTNALRGTGFGIMKAAELLDMMVLKTGSHISAINTLDRLSSYYCYKKESDMGPLLPYTVIVKEKQMVKLLQWWYKNRNLRRLYLLGINNKEINGSNMAPEKMYEQCLENPYVIYSLSIDKCDSIMNRIGKEPDPITRKCAEVSRKIYEYMSRGWSGIPTGILIKMFPDVTQYVDHLREAFNIKTELHTAYLDYPHQVETGICDLVANLLDGPTLPHALKPSEIQYTRDLSADQKRAIERALSDNISIIKGIAGSGKTTAIKEIIHNLDLNDIKYRVVSFTGKAVARIREVIDKKEPMTMHMTITLAGKKQTPFNHLIIDEASMVTSELLYEFVQKYGSDYRITLIGDPHQLTPIGWGTMFSQMIESRIIPMYNLVTCHRVSNSGQRSGILVNANSIVECNEPGYNGPPFEFEETNDFNILEGDISIVKDLVMALQNCGTDSSKITIICPYNKYLPSLNKMCQDIYNSTNRCVHDGSVVWRINDRVMMTENNYKINVMNGDEGRITDVTNTQIQVTFKDGTSHVFLLNLDETGEDENKTILTTSSLTHSFAVSVHRYQGSEADYVVFYIPESAPSKFLNRNLLYTGIIRAKQIIWMVGDYDTMVRAATTAPPYRCDNLSQRLQAMRQISME